MKFLFASFLLPALALSAPQTEGTFSRPLNLGHWEIGFTGYSMDYKEVIPPPGKSNENGALFGFKAAVHYPFDDTPLFLRGALRLSGAKTRYDGSLQYSDGSGYAGPAKGTTENAIVDLDGLFGVEVGFGTSVYFGVSTRRWIRDLKGPFGYLEDYRMLMLPVGLRFIAPLGSVLSLELDASLRVLLAGNVLVRSHALPLGSAPGGRVALATVWSLGRSSDSGAITFTPWYEQINIAQGWPVETRPGIASFEPASNNHQFGVDLGFRLSY